MNQELLSQGYGQSKNDASLFIKRTTDHISIAAIYVDDIILIGSNPTEIQKLKQRLNKVFSIKDLDKLYYFLGIEVSEVSQGIVLTQKNCTNKLLVESGLTQFRHGVTPLPINLKLQAIEGALLPNPSYRSLVGKLNFLTHTRPHLSYTVQVLSQFMQCPRYKHFKALKHTLCCVFHIAGQGILLKGSNHLTLEAFSDLDWVACPNSRRSVSGYLLLFGQSPISWKSKK